LRWGGKKGKDDKKKKESLKVVIFSFRLLIGQGTLGLGKWNQESRDCESMVMEERNKKKTDDRFPRLPILW